MSPKYSIITTCKGRLHNLECTLPEFLKQENTEVIVVDYDCPDGTSDYVAQAHPAVSVVRVPNSPRFNTSHARNLGAAQARGEFLIFLDADVVIAEHFVNHVDSRMKDRSFALFGPPAQNSLRGSCVVWRKNFERIGGYDELLGGYEGEDLELYMRLRLIGARQLMLEPVIVIEVIEQSDEERERYRSPDIKKQFLRGQLYMATKEMVMSVQGTPVLPLALREEMLAEINRNLDGLYAGEKDFLLEVNLPDKYKRGFLQEWEFSRSISFKARRKKPKAQ
jgi:glycosyltransferase involved in cell wall biosynthesis